jgi:hypothetical protein
MYERKEHIEEENLDWGEHLEKIDQPEVDTEKKEIKKVIHPSTEDNKFVFQKKVKLNIKREISDLLAQYPEISLVLSFLTFPYVIGFLVIAFILLYGGVPFDRFFSEKEGIFHFELWSIGSYIFVTTVVIWLVIMLLRQRR